MNWKCFGHVLPMALLLALVGCVTFSGKDLPKMTGFPTPAAKPAVAISYSFRTFLNDRERNSTEFFREKFNKLLMARFSRSGLFSSVERENGNADVLVNVEVTHRGYGSSALAMLSGLTLTIIPCRAEDEYHVSASIVNKRTNETQRIEVSDSGILWIHLLLFPATPFYRDQKTFEKEMLNNLMDTFALRVYETYTAKAAH